MATVTAEVNMKKLLVTVAAVASVAGALAGDLPWDGTKLVFGDAYRDTTNELEAPATTGPRP